MNGLKPIEDRKVEQLTIRGLARRRYWTLFNNELIPLVMQCQDLADAVSKGTFEQWTEGLISSSEFLNKVMFDLANGNALSVNASVELLHRADVACRKFVKTCEAMAWEVCPHSWELFTSKQVGAYTACCDLSSALNNDATA